MLFIILYSLLHFVPLARCTCESYGIDFVNGGSYFIDNTEAVGFNFLSQFEGCDDESITPILVDPDENEYFCSAIATSPDDVSEISTCPVVQTAMFNGDWYIVIEGLTFAYVRTFLITVGTPATIIATPTITVGITIVPSAITSTSTSTDINSTTLTAATITDACKTIFVTSTIRPPPVTTTQTKTITITSTTKTVCLTTSSTLTSTAICTPPPYLKAVDPSLQKILALKHTTISPPSGSRSSTSKAVSHPRHARDMMVSKGTRGLMGAMMNLVWRNPGVMRRGPDEATVTVTETTSTATAITTTTLAASTVVETAFTTSISTITPAPVTVCHGVTKITSTTTLPTHTFTSFKITSTTVYVTKSITLCHTFKTTTTPKALSTSCILGGGHI